MSSNPFEQDRPVPALAKQAWNPEFYKDMTTPRKSSPAYDAIWQTLGAGSPEVWEKLSEEWPGFPQGREDFLGDTWLSRAVYSGNPAAVAWILGKGAEVSVLEKDGYTPLHSAIDSENGDSKYEIMGLLIEAGADLNARGFNDWTPAHLAGARNDLRALKMICEAGGDLSVRTRIDWYATPLEELEHLEAMQIGFCSECLAYLRERATE